MAEVERLEDRYHTVIGYLHIESNGNKKLEDRYHQVLGYYYKNTNQTLDKYHTVIGYGDILAMLLNK